MDECNYGVDMEGDMTPVIVRDAIIRCFKAVHAEVLENMKESQDFKSEEEFEKLKEIDVKLLV